METPIKLAHPAGPASPCKCAMAMEAVTNGFDKAKFVLHIKACSTEQFVEIAMFLLALP